MQLSPTTYLLWSTTTLLAVVVCAFAFYRRLFAWLPFFTSYLGLLLVRDLVLWSVYLGFGYSSAYAFYYFWLSQALLLSARGAAVAELAWRALREYRGIWGFGWRLLSLLALVLLVIAAWDAGGNVHWVPSFILALERGLEFVVAGVLLALLLLGGYYGMPLEPVQRSVALGLCFYSTFQVLNNTLLRQWLRQYFELGNDLRVASTGVALVIWLVALLKPLTAARPAPVLLSQQVYDQVSPRVNYRLRALNQKLLEMFEA